MYLDSFEIVPDISEEETAAENVRAAIESGDLYDADTMWEELFDEDHHITAYDGMTLDDIEKAINSEDVMPKGHAAWEEI